LIAFVPTRFWNAIMKKLKEAQSDRSVMRQRATTGVGKVAHPMAMRFRMPLLKM
jgi:hypothetical protein